jgi:hypothetical protein
VDTHKIATLEGLAEGRAEDFVKVHSTAMLGLVIADPPAAGSQQQQQTTTTVAAATSVASSSSSAVTTRSRRAVTKGLEPIVETEAEPQPQPQQQPQQPKSTTITFSGMLTGGDTCPETLLFDLHRLRSMRQEFEHISLVVALLITASHNMQVWALY